MGRHKELGRWVNTCSTFSPNVITATPTAPATRPFPAPVMILALLGIIAPTLGR
jgi:hypothetical protein